jgi:hypothetical protein
VADQLADITQLTYEPESVDEVRLHHVGRGDRGYQRVLEALEILRGSLVDEPETELRLLAEWSGLLRASA